MNKLINFLLKLWNDIKNEGYIGLVVLRMHRPIYNFHTWLSMFCVISNNSVYYITASYY